MPLGWLGRILGRTRFIVVVAVIAVMFVSVSLFLLGSIKAATRLYAVWNGVFQGNTEALDLSLSLEFLQIVGTMLEAVVFYLVGIGLYSLFIAPLNITRALGIETLTDLESKVLSVIVVIMSTVFLQHFIQWKEPLQTLQFGAALAFVVVALVLFQRFTHRASEDRKAENPDRQLRAQKEMFQSETEHYEIKPDEVQNPDKQTDDKKSEREAKSKEEI